MSASTAVHGDALPRTRWDHVADTILSEDVLEYLRERQRRSYDRTLTRTSGTPPHETPPDAEGMTPGGPAEHLQRQVCGALLHGLDLQLIQPDGIRRCVRMGVLQRPSL